LALGPGTWAGCGEETDAEQEAVVPPLEPEHDQLQGPEPVTDEAVPILQRLMVGAEARVAPLDEPHAPLTGGGGDWGASCAEQLAVVPPLEPAHDQSQGPVPVTDEAVPVLQRLVVGADSSVAPLNVPQTPFTGGGKI